MPALANPAAACCVELRQDLPAATSRHAGVPVVATVWADSPGSRARLLPDRAVSSSSSRRSGPARSGAGPVPRRGHGRRPGARGPAARGRTEPAHGAALPARGRRAAASGADLPRRHLSHAVRKARDASAGHRARRSPPPRRHSLFVDETHVAAPSRASRAGRSPTPGCGTLARRFGAPIALRPRRPAADRATARSCSSSSWSSRRCSSPMRRRRRAALRRDDREPHVTERLIPVPTAERGCVRCAG